jgi:hypothetical protein
MRTMNGTAKLGGVLASVALALANAATSAGAREAAPAVGWPATAAGTISLRETGHLHLTSKHNFTLNEQGSASGTVRGTIFVHLTAVSSSRVTVEVNIYARASSISGHGTGSYRRVGTAASFSGSMTIGRGTGSFAHVHGTGLSFSGTIQESGNDPITVYVSGRVAD